MFLYYSSAFFPLTAYLTISSKRTVQLGCTISRPSSMHLDTLLFITVCELRFTSVESRGTSVLSSYLISIAVFCIRAARVIDEPW